MNSGYDKAICRVMLYSYPMLEHKCEEIDKDIYNTAIRSAFKNTMATYKDIERLTNEKIAYINVKVIIEHGISLLTSNYEIKQHHLKGVSLTDLAQALGASEIAVRDRIRRQRARLYERVLSVYKTEELLDILCNSNWLMSRYKRELKQIRSESAGELSSK